MKLSVTGFGYPSRPLPVPSVSIVMPVLNAAPYLPAAIDSVLCQTTRVAWELLIVDDGSWDGSKQIAATYARTHPDRIRTFQHAGSRNRGTSISRNLGLQHARGAVIAFLDGDDVWLPHMLQHQLALLSRFPEADLVYANAERTWDMTAPCLVDSFQPDGDNTLPALLPAGIRPGLLDSPGPLSWFLEDESMVPCTCTVLVRARAARAVGGFVESFDGLYDDQAFYAKLVLQGRTAMSTACVARYRKHHDSCCARTWTDAQLQRSARLAFERWLKTYQEELCSEPQAVAIAE